MGLLDRDYYHEDKKRRDKLPHVKQIQPHLRRQIEAIRPVSLFSYLRLLAWPLFWVIWFCFMVVSFFKLA